jgi:hypothetical protein
MQLSGRVKTAILTNIVLRKRNPHPHQSTCPSLDLPEISAIDFITDILYDRVDTSRKLCHFFRVFKPNLSGQTMPVPH